MQLLSLLLLVVVAVVLLLLLVGTVNGFGDNMVTDKRLALRWSS